MFRVSHTGEGIGDADTIGDDRQIVRASQGAHTMSMARWDALTGGR